MTYKLLNKTLDGVRVLARIEHDGKCRLTCTEQDQAYLAWLSEGNTPEPADPIPAPTYQELRRVAYPPATDYLDGIVKGDAAQVQAYVDACLAVKAKYPKG